MLLLQGVNFQVADGVVFVLQVCHCEGEIEAHGRGVDRRMMLGRCDDVFPAVCAIINA